MRQLQITCTNLLLLVCKLPVCRLIHDDIDTLLIDNSGCNWAGGLPVKPGPLWYIWKPSYRNKLSIPHSDICLMMLILGWLVGQGFISLVREGNYHRSCCPSNTKETTPNYIVYSYYSWCRLLWWYLYMCMQWQLSVRSVITTGVVAPFIPCETTPSNKY